MTGRYNFRNYTKFKHLDPDQKTIGHIARQAGYSTAVCGKWQLDGEQTDDFATKFGFDSYCLWYLNQKNYGSRYSNPKLVRNGKTFESPGEFGPDIVNQFALDFITENRDKPFLLYYPMILPHFPFVPTPDSEEWDPAGKLPKLQDKTARLERDHKFFIDMVEYADKLVGKVVGRLDELGIRDNTLIMFTSDNGTYRSLVSRWRDQDYRGGKGFLMNKGTHVPLIASWPSEVSRGQQSGSLIDFTDFLATIAELTGQPVTDNNLNGYAVDGHSFAPLLRGQAFEGREFSYCHYDPKWGTPEQGQWVRNQNYKIYGSGLVYNLERDYFETTPVSRVPEEDIGQVEMLSAVLAEMKNQGSRPEEKLKREGLPAGKPKNSESGNDKKQRGPKPRQSSTPRVSGNKRASFELPNIILVMADDQGYGDTGFNGHPTLRTPHMDSMAASAIVFDRFYAAAPVCSPTRASVMTGRNPVRTNVPNHGHYLRPHETTIAEALTSVGYVTGHFGKWHIGSVQSGSPTSPGGQGFDEWLSGLNFFDIDPYLSRNGVYEQVVGQGSVIAMDATLEFIKKHQSGDKPIFAVTWFPAPHDPHREQPVNLPAGITAYEGKHQGYYQEIQLIDQQLGRLRATLRDLGMAENTIVWYCSDNGGLVSEHSGGRAKKGSIYEGGLRVPSMLEWPARFSFRTIETPAFTSDIYPTLLAIAGASVEHQPRLDGIDLQNVISGVEADRPPMGFWHHFAKGQGTRSDKLIKTLLQAQQAGQSTPLPERLLKNVNEFPDLGGQACQGHAAWNKWPWKLHRIEDKGQITIELYNLEQDPMEESDCSDTEVERTRTMRKELEAWQKSVLESAEGKDYVNR